MYELDPIEITTTQLEPGCEQKLIIGQPYPGTVLLSHFEVTALSPKNSVAELTALCIEKLDYLLMPMPLALIQREQLYMQERIEEKRRQVLERQLEPSIAHTLLKRLGPPNRQETRFMQLDAQWEPRQLLTVTFKNAGRATVDKVSIELILYRHKKPPLAAN